MAQLQEGIIDVSVWAALGIERYPNVRHAARSVVGVLRWHEGCMTAGGGPAASRSTPRLVTGRPMKPGSANRRLVPLGRHGPVIAWCWRCQPRVGEPGSGWSGTTRQVALTIGGGCRVTARVMPHPGQTVTGEGHSKVSQATN